MSLELSVVLGDPSPYARVVDADSDQLTEILTSQRKKDGFRPEADNQDVVRLSTTTLAFDCCDQLIDSCCRVYDQLRLVGYAPLCKLTSKLRPKVLGP